jgi:hypothetical protein
MIKANTSVTAFASVTGRLWLAIPNNSQSRVPKVNRPYIYSEMPAVFFVLMVLMACGIKETVVQKAAHSPMIVIQCIKNVEADNLNPKKSFPPDKAG